MIKFLPKMRSSRFALSNTNLVSEGNPAAIPEITTGLKFIPSVLTIVTVFSRGRMFSTKELKLDLMSVLMGLTWSSTNFLNSFLDTISFNSSSKSQSKDEGGSCSKLVS